MCPPFLRVLRVRFFIVMLVRMVPVTARGPVDIADNLMEAIGCNEKDIRMIMGVALYLKRSLSAEQAAKIVGIMPDEFCKSMCFYGVSHDECQKVLAKRGVIAK